MKRLLTIVFLNLICLTSVIAQEPTLLGTEQVFSRSLAGLVGPVRTVLTVDKRDMGGFAKTFNTVVDSYDIKGVAVDSMIHNTDIEIHSGELVRLDYSFYYLYDSSGKLIRMTRYMPNGSPSIREEYLYDHSGRLVEINQYSGEKTVLQKRVITYEPEKRQTTVKWSMYYDQGKEPSVLIIVYTFNSKGQAIERTSLNADRSLTHRIVYSYDDRGNLSREAHYHGKNEYGWTNFYAYKLDSKGNWVEREERYTETNREPNPADEARTVTYRVITYYRN